MRRRSSGRSGQDDAGKGTGARRWAGQHRLIIEDLRRTASSGGDEPDLALFDDYPGPAVGDVPQHSIPTVRPASDGALVVKVINHYGDEVLRVSGLSEGLRAASTR